jgi:hypothetical protein
MDHTHEEFDDEGMRHRHTDREVTPELLMFFGRMESKLDHIMAWTVKHEAEQEKIEGRISELERAHARNMGIAGGISFVVSTVAAVVSYALTIGGGK